MDIGNCLSSAKLKIYVSVVTYQELIRIRRREFNDELTLLKSYENSKDNNRTCGFSGNFCFYRKS